MEGNQGNSALHLSHDSRQDKCGHSLDNSQEKIFDQVHQRLGAMKNLRERERERERERRQRRDTAH